MTNVVPIRRDPWISTAELAEHCGVSERTVLRWVRDGMPHERWGRKLLRYKVVEVETWLRSRAA